MASITKSYAEQLADLKALEAVGGLATLADQEAAAQIIFQAEGRPFTTLDRKYVIYSTDQEMAAAFARRDAEIAAAQTPAAVRKATDEAERQACAIDAQILPLVNQTKAEWITWAGTNFPSLTANEKTRLGMLFWVVSVGVRRAIRNGGG